MNPIHISEDVAELVVQAFEQTYDGDNYFESMRNLALISKAFVEPVRKRIFNKVVLDDKTDYEHLYSLSASYPHIFPHVRKFHLDAYLYMEDPELVEILSNLVNVKNVGISFRQPGSEPDREETYNEFDHAEDREEYDDTEEDDDWEEDDADEDDAEEGDDWEEDDDVTEEGDDLEGDDALQDSDLHDEEDTEEADPQQNVESDAPKWVPYKIVWVDDVAQDIDSKANAPGNSFSWSQDFSAELQDALGKVFKVPTLEYLYLEGIYDIPQVYIKSILRVSEVSFKNIGFAQDDSDIQDQSQDVISDCRIRYLAIESLSLEAIQPFIEAMPPSTLEALYVTNLGQDHANVAVAQNIIDTQRSLTSLTIKDERAQLDLHNLPNLQYLHIHLSFFRKPLRDVLPTLRTINTDNRIQEFKVFMEYWCFCLVEVCDNRRGEWDVVDDLLSEKLRKADRIIWAIMPTRDPEILVPEHFSYVRCYLPKTNQTRLLQLVVRDDK